MLSHSSCKWQVIAQEEMPSKCTKEGLEWTLENISSPKRLSSFGIVCPEKWLIYYSWRYLKDTSCLVPWFGGRLGDVGLMVGLHDLKGSLQPNDAGINTN